MYNINDIYLIFTDMFFKLNTNMGKEETQYEHREDIHNLKYKKLNAWVHNVSQWNNLVIPEHVHYIFTSEISILLSYELKKKKKKEFFTICYS